jgi:formate-dependent nitrite reductase cytochrome c552 subunit
MATLLPHHSTYARRLSLLLLGLLAAFVLLLTLPHTAQAQEASEPAALPTEEVKPCTSCHEDEADSWMASPHGMAVNPDTGEAAATCTSCHGDYVRGHPDEALTPLRVDSSSCRDCHAATTTQWEASIHGAEGVQCISCHQPHSQEMRLTDERQCTACHQESLDDPMHTAHWEAETACTDCHMAEIAPGAALALAHADGEALASVLPTTNHDFVSVSSAKCLDCHSGDVSLTQPAAVVRNVANVREVEAALSSTQAALAGARQTNRSLTIFSLANLGFGLGIGSVLGVVFMLAYIRFGQPAARQANAQRDEHTAQESTGDEGGQS